MSKKTVLLAIVVVVLILPFTAFGLLISNSSSPTVSLGTAAPFAVLAYSGITNTGTTTITGNVGSYPTASETGFGTVTVVGTNYPAGAPSSTQTDLAGAITQAMSYTPTTILTALDSVTLVPGVYKAASTTFTLSGGVLTLNGNGNTASVWIFQAAAAIAGALSTTGGSVVLTNGASSCNVFWVTSAGGATLGTSTTFVGTILAYSSVTLAAGTTLQGAALANTGDVTMSSNTISNTCVTAPVTSTSTSTTSTTTSTTTISTTSTTTISTTSTTTISTISTTTTHTIVPIISRVCSTITPPPTPLVYLTINTTTTSGSPLPGLLILCNSQNGQLTSTVYSPARIGLDTATNHSIGVDDSGCYVFDHWSDTGSTNRFRTVSITSNTTYTAIFRNTCVPTPAGYSTINVGTSIANGGNASLGLYATLWQNGNLLQSCYTTCTFTVPNGQSYQVVINNFGNYFFTKWSDGVLTSTHTVTLAAGSTNSNIVLTAVIGFSLSLSSSQLWAVNEGLAGGATCDVSVGGSPLYTNQSSALTIAQKIIVGSPDLACGTLMPVTYLQVLYQNINSGGGWVVFWHNP